MKTTTKAFILVLSCVAVSSCFEFTGKNYIGDKTVNASFNKESFSYISSDYTNYFAQDSIYADSSFVVAEYLAFYSDMEKNKVWNGGCGVVAGSYYYDIYSEDDLPTPHGHFRVWAPESIQKDNDYAFWSDSGDEKMMPEHDFTSFFYYGDEDSYLTPSLMFVNNTFEVVNEVRNGINIGTSFQQGDYINLAIKGSYNGKETGVVNFKLADYNEKRDSVVTTWTMVDLRALGRVDAIDFEITSNRPITKNFCFDNLIVDAHIEY